MKNRMNSPLDDVIVAVEPQIVPINDKTTFVFVHVSTSSGCVGLGEASHRSSQQAVLTCLDRLRHRVVGQPLGRLMSCLFDRLDWKDGMAMGAALSSIEQAYWDLLGKLSDMPVWMLMGGGRQEALTCYANINRSVKDRQIPTWRKQAALAVKHGFDSVKIAPFDHIDWQDGFAGLKQMQHGFDVIAAVREEIGPNRRLMVDCHWRFNPVMAREVIAELTKSKVFWIEGLIAEKASTFGELKLLKSQANRNDILLAGGEYLTGYDESLLALEQSVFDVINPDIRYCGGPQKLHRLGAIAADKGICFSPHNPDGPIMDAMTAHICHALPASLMLERQFAEEDFLEDLVLPVQAVSQQSSSVLCQKPGLGLELNPAALARLGVSELKTPGTNRAYERADFQGNA